MSSQQMADVDMVWRRCGPIALIVFFFLFSAACSSEGSGGSADADQDCVWDESEWNECDWA